MDMDPPWNQYRSDRRRVSSEYPSAWRIPSDTNEYVSGFVNEFAQWQRRPCLR